MLWFGGTSSEWYIFFYLVIFVSDCIWQRSHPLMKIVVFQVWCPNWNSYSRWTKNTWASLLSLLEHLCTIHIQYGHFVLLMHPSIGQIKNMWHMKFANKNGHRKKCTYSLWILNTLFRYEIIDYHLATRPEINGTESWYCKLFSVKS